MRTFITDSSIWEFDNERYRRKPRAESEHGFNHPGLSYQEAWLPFSYMDDLKTYDDRRQLILRGDGGQIIVQTGRGRWEPDVFDQRFAEWCQNPNR